MNYKWLIIILLIIAAFWLSSPNNQQSLLSSLKNDSTSGIQNQTPSSQQTNGNTINTFNNSSTSSTALNRTTNNQPPQQITGEITTTNYTPFTFPIAGDGKCSNGEKCDSPDCPCTEGFTCSESFVCISKTVCGDGINSPGETCCTDSGCPGGKFCDETIQECKLALPALANGSIQSILANYSAYDSDLDSIPEELEYLSQFPDEVDGKPVTVVIASCGTNCTKYLIVNASGQVQGEIQ